MTAPTTDLRDHLAAFEAAALRLLRIPAATCHPGRPEWRWHRCRECWPTAQAEFYARYDVVVVERVISGWHTGPIRIADAAEVVRRMAAHGYSDGQIAYRLRRSVRSVERVRARRGIPAALPRGGANQHTRHPGVPSINGKAAA